MNRTQTMDALATFPSKLLIVDHQAINITLLYEPFSADHEIFVATRGEEAIDACKEELPDLILLDVANAGIFLLDSAVQNAVAYFVLIRSALVFAFVFAALSRMAEKYGERMLKCSCFIISGWRWLPCELEQRPYVLRDNREQSPP